VGHGEKDGVGAVLGEGADEEGLCGGEGKFAGEGGQAEASVGVGLGGEVAAEEGNLGEAAGGEDEAFEEVGEGDHGAKAG